MVVDDAVDYLAAEFRAEPADRQNPEPVAPRKVLSVLCATPAFSDF
jgi:hypothetical protein